MQWRQVLVTFVAALVFLSACGAPDEPSEFGPVLSTIDQVVGTDLTATGVVALSCIPSRSDPVGVWLGMRVVAAEVGDDMFTLDLIETDARLGSHPSGCSNPETLLAQSVFLFDGDVPVFATEQAMLGEATRLVFALDGRAPAELDVVILPTFAFEVGDGMRQTTIFGLIGRYSLV